MQDFHLAKRFYDLALETSLEAYLPATLSLMGLYARSLYHTISGKDEELKLLSLFNGPAAASPAELLAAQAPTINAWSIDRTWRAVQRQWGVDPGPDPAVARAGAGGAKDAGARAQEQVREVKGKMEEVRRRFDEERGDEWGGQGGRERREGEDEFDFEGEGDLGGTVAIVMLCIFLGSVRAVLAGTCEPVADLESLVSQSAVHDAPERDPSAERAPPASQPTAARAWCDASGAGASGRANASPCTSRISTRMIGAATPMAA